MNANTINTIYLRTNLVVKRWRIERVRVDGAGLICCSSFRIAWAAHYLQTLEGDLELHQIEREAGDKSIEKMIWHQWNDYLFTGINMNEKWCGYMYSSLVWSLLMIYFGNKCRTKGNYLSCNGRLTIIHLLIKATSRHYIDEADNVLVCCVTSSFWKCLFPCYVDVLLLPPAISISQRLYEWKSNKPALIVIKNQISRVNHPLKSELSICNKERRILHFHQRWAARFSVTCSEWISGREYHRGLVFASSAV